MGVEETATALTFMAQVIRKELDREGLGKESMVRFRKKHRQGHWKALAANHTEFQVSD